MILFYHLQLIVETSFYQEVYPVEIHAVGSFVGKFCKNRGVELPIPFDASIVNMQVQSLERTFIDKVFGMTQEELAEALYVEKSIISYYENDKKEMRASGLAEIAKVLQTTPNYLLGFADNNDGFADEALGLLRDVKDQSVREILLKQIRALI